MLEHLSKWLIRGAIVAGSLLLALAMTEAYLRWNWSLEELFEPLQYDPRLASEGWERCFVRDYGKLRKRGRIGNDLGGYVHDPDLGWDTPRHIRGAREYPLDKPRGSFRVLAIGDSYTYGAEVSYDQSFPHHLERLLETAEVINFGVRAYGIDQAVLKYLKYGRAYRPDLVIFAIWGPDYLRVPLTFYRFAKPLYVLDPATNAVALTHIPIPPPEMMYARLCKNLPPFLFTYGLLLHTYHLTVEEDAEHHRYYQEWDPLIEGILRHLLDTAREDGTSVLLALIETGEQFRDNDGVARSCCEEEHLLEIFRRLHADTIDLGRELLKTYSHETIYKSMYFHHDGFANGHFTSVGNQAVAERLAAYIQERLRIQ
jgi:lysophospholipase L1-like esterase